MPAGELTTALSDVSAPSNLNRGAMKNQAARHPQAGFSMIELTIAMLVTLIVSGAIYAMVGVGGNAFRREPALTDRQQNIRIAMDLVSRDVQNAGASTPMPWIQLFTQGLDGAGPAAPAGGDTDFLELIGNDGSCPDLAVCSLQGVSMNTKVTLPGCYSLPGIVLVFGDTQSRLMYGCPPGNAQNNSSSCGSTGNSGGGSSGGGSSGGGNSNPNGHIVFPPGQGPDDMNPPGGNIGFVPTGISPVTQVRYEIRLDSEGVPNLWRSPFGGRDVDGNGGNQGGSCADSTGDLGDGWEMVARGIEDLQVRYMSQGDFAADTWTDEPPAMVANNYNTIVRQVEITLRARTVGQANLTGQTTQGGITAVRGALQTRIAPRAALQMLGLAENPLYR
jgi:prepilin-type N-terminal cleavage/methylation domain-containing protein